MILHCVEARGQLVVSRYGEVGHAEFQDVSAVSQTSAPGHSCWIHSGCNRVGIKSNQIKSIERGGINTIGKAHFTALYGPARQRGLARRISFQDGRKAACILSTPLEC